MEPLLILSLFLAVGGELLQYSTDIIYVSKGGTDNSNCLNGESHCKTLDYVLTNIPRLQCTNCTVLVTCDHVVGLLSNTPYIVNISSIEALYIIGLGQPNLDFNGSGLKLVNNDNNTSVILKNFEINGCSTCISTEDVNGDNTYYLLKFMAINVNLTAGYYGDTCVSITAKHVYCHSSYYYNCNISIKAPEVVDSEIVLLNRNAIQSHLSIGYPQNSKSLSNNTVIIRQCNFINTTVMLSTMDCRLCIINFNMEKCWLVAASIKLTFGDYTTGSALIANNYHTLLRNHDATSIDGPYSSQVICNDKCSVAVKYYNNHFIDNMAKEVLHIEGIINIDIENNSFINNTVNNSVLFVQCNNTWQKTILIKNSTFLHNKINALPVADKGAIVRLTAITDIESSGIKILYLNFTNNTGTPLSIMKTRVTITGDIVFSNNNAITGGGMYVGDDGYVTIADNATVNVTFINNVALYGGAIYADTQHCFLNFHHQNSIMFNGNHANIGSSIFSSYDWCSLKCDIPIQNIYIASLPTNISFNISNTTSVFPGQTIVGDMTAFDCLGSASSCLADVTLRCEKTFCHNYGIQGSLTIFLSNGTINTGLKITTNSEHASFNQAQLKIICKSHINNRQSPLVLTVDITVLLCPLGFVFNSSTGQCECINNGNEYFICKKDIGLVCVKEGYWYSIYSGTASKCIHLFCDYSKQRKVCPSTVSPDSTDYLLLDSSLDDQCIDGHGGTLCTGCALNKLPTYGALKCIDSNKCTRWHPYILMLLNIAIPFIDGVFLMIVIRLKLSIGSGYLYGPLFYLAVLNLIPLTSYSTLNTIISSFATILLLQLTFLGYVPWCFFPSVSLLTSKWFELIGPSVVAVVLLLTVYLARCSPKLLENFQKSPLQAMCVLVLVLFWSLASTSISVITPVYLSGVEGARVYLQPDVAYLTGDHIPLWIMSVIILLMLYLIVFVLIFSRFLNLHRLKPILDEFQSCYKDSYRWYGGVYFIMWTILQVLVISSNYELFQTVIIVLTVTHCLLQPYCKKWLNVMDGLFLGSLLSISSCLLSSSGTIVTRVLVYISVMVPLCVISLGIVSIVIVRFGIMSKLSSAIHKIPFITKKLSHTQPAPVPSQSSITRSVLNIESSASNYREPLLHYIQDSTNGYGATDN